MELKKLTEDQAWEIFNLIRDWQDGKFGIVPLKNVLDGNVEIKSDYETICGRLALAFMDYLDNHKKNGKMCLSNMECEDIDKAFEQQDWAKLYRYIQKYIG